MENKKTIIALSVLLLVVVVTIGAFVIVKNQNNKETIDNKQTAEQNNDNLEEENKNKEENKVEKNPIVTMKIKKFGTVKIELYPEIAPITVANFIDLIQNKYYDGLIFHRIIPGFMAQGGDKEGTGSGKNELSIKGEFSKNGINNTLKHEKGVISMARADYSSLGKTKEGYNSAFSQFFIMFEDNSSLDGSYAAFGKVIEGMEVIDALAKVKIGANDRPVNPPVIEKMTVDTFGVDYKPERMNAFDVNAYINRLQGK